MQQFKMISMLLLCCMGFTHCKKQSDVPLFTVSIESNGGMNIAPVKVRSGERIPLNRLFPDPIIADGGKFGGWFADAGLKDSFNFDTPVTGNLTLYAKWIYPLHRVTFRMNGGGAIDPVDVIEGRTLSLQKPGREGYVFVGWYADEGLTNIYNMNTKIVSDLTLYARWVQPSPQGWFNIDAAGNLLSCAPPEGTTTVVIPEGVKTIPDWFVLANGLNQPGKPGFPSGKAVKEFILPESVEKIGTGAFKFAAITSIILPPGIKQLDPVSFEQCDQLIQFAFAANSQLEKLVSNASNEAVISSASLKTISFPPSLQYIGKYTLNGCSALQSVTFERASSPVIINDYLPGGGVWLFGGYFPGSVRVPEEVRQAFLAGIRLVMQDYEYGQWAGILQGY
ncbi:InlB B-repeat-containing protein [Niabella drilacis]|uniref:Listeria/Bacterioides repeat-containing protein n=1 Tax=Niabella drilacis (strain DSM 25811 / CCM 8410 / CCUG 62505 / LMG 26954 / E90) TaxID=1285928 RepID=A0A1G6WZW0_NIADE|nr:InlB B-repeat-containing protein [Niabella drilacis]SDD71510.1 Listeria/Bacterioides repeat-containing protein [Niabella drilacis]